MEDTRTVQQKLQHIHSLDCWRDMEIQARIAEEEERWQEEEERERKRLEPLAEEHVIRVPSHEGRCAICLQCVHQFALCPNDFRTNKWICSRGSGSVRRRRSGRRG